MHLVVSYFLARLAEPSTRAALAAAAGSLVAGALGQVSWEAALTGVATAAVPAFVPEGARGVLIAIASSLAEQRVRAEGAAKKVGAIVLLLAGLGLSACAGSASPELQLQARDGLDKVPDVVRHACAGLSVAHGVFVAARPALVDNKAISPQDVKLELDIFAQAEALCADPPADTSAAVQKLLIGSASIYALLAQR